MKNRTYSGVYVGWIFIVTALALVTRETDIFSSGEAGSNWWAFFLLIPAGGFGLKAFRRWREDARRTSRSLMRASLMILPVFAACLYPSLWKVIYIPFIVLLGVDMIFGNLMLAKDRENRDLGNTDRPDDSNRDNE